MIVFLIIVIIIILIIIVVVIDTHLFGVINNKLITLTDIINGKIYNNGKKSIHKK